MSAELRPEIRLVYADECFLSAGYIAYLGYHDMDLGALHRFLADRIEGLGSELHVEPVAGGQSNPTFFITSGSRRLVLRKKPAGVLLPSAHAIDREYRVLSALAATDVPCPRVLALHMDADILDAGFYVMERVDGRVFHESALPGVSATDRAAIYRSLAAALASLHAVDVASVGLSDFGRPANYFARQLARWVKQRELSNAEPSADFDWLVGWLGTNLPPDSARARIAHGDFRIGNVIVHPTEPRVVAILDWELCTLGEPLSDLAHCCAFTWHMTQEEYGGTLGLALAGLPSESEFIASYCDHADHDEVMTPFHLAFALFRNACIFEGIAGRARQGTAASANAAHVGRLAAALTQRAVAIARRA